jgi:hypothetical protein
MNSTQAIDSLILTIRGQNVILDADLAVMYGTTTKALNQAIKRNKARFPIDFVFQIKPSEIANLRSHFASESKYHINNQYDGILRSQIVTSSHGGRRVSPSAFTEHGALMAANFLNSSKAVKMSLYIIRAFIKQRELMIQQADILKQLAEMDQKLIQHDEVLRMLWNDLQPLLEPPPPKPRREIGFH